MSLSSATVLLGLTPLQISATNTVHAKAVKRAYLARTLQCHPDLHPEDPTATEKFRLLSEALRIVLKHQQRTQQALSMRHAPRDDPLSDAAASSTILSASDMSHELWEAVRGYYQCHRSHRGGNGDFKDVSSTSLFHALRTVCSKERSAAESIKVITRDLPFLLSKAKREPTALTLFEVHPHFVRTCADPMQEVMQRFYKALPQLVCRVVQSRSQQINKRKRKLLSLGDNSLSLSPLVLLGALVFRPYWSSSEDPESKNSAEHKNNTGDTVEDMNQTSSTDTSTGAAGGPECEPHSAGNSAHTDKNETLHSSSMPSLESVHIVRELQCILYHGDVLNDHVAKFSQWEVESLRRLEVEVEIQKSVRLLSALLDIPLVAHSQLHLPFDVAQGVAATVQQLLHLFCGIVGRTERVEVGSMDADVVTGPRDEFEKRCATLLAQLQHLYRSLVGDKTLVAEEPVSLSVAEDHAGTLILGVASSPVIRLDTFDEEKVVVAPVDGSSGSSPVEEAKSRGFLVMRYPWSCEASEIKYSFCVHFHRTASQFLGNFLYALLEVRRRASKSRELLPKLVEVRDQVQRAELWSPQNGTSRFLSRDADFSPLTVESRLQKLLLGKHREEDVDPFLSNNQTEALVNTEGFIVNTDKTADDVETKFRPPFDRVVRIFNMEAIDEHHFWNLLFVHRFTIGQHATLCNSLNVYFDRVPPAAARIKKYASFSSVQLVDFFPGSTQLSDFLEAGGGWWSTVTGEGDDVYLSKETLRDATASSGGFSAWLEDVLQQSSLNKDATSTLEAHGVYYVERDPYLPPAQFLSFVKGFVTCTAARAAMEHPAAVRGGVNMRKGGGGGVGMVLVVGSVARVRSSGVVEVPWDSEPSQLVSLLQGDDDSAKALT